MGGVFMVPNPLVVGEAIRDRGVEVDLAVSSAADAHYQGVRGITELLATQTVEEADLDVWLPYDRRWLRAFGLTGATLDAAVEARNQAESLIHSTEKSMEEHSDKVDPTTIEAIELAIAALKDDLEKDDASADKIKSGIQNVTEAAMKLGEAIYKASQEEGDGEPEPADMGGADDDIVDAEFEDLDDDKRA